MQEEARQRRLAEIQEELAGLHREMDSLVEDMRIATETRDVTRAAAIVDGTTRISERIRTLTREWGALLKQRQP